eukprot:CAMPEP_0202697614 /NCGR_PEP_ID=MMETSP1385-20130828/10939_1 /ASSEMBLY_ACC=CAM_ASM_000861 /TAXON_ID=933848 /ORGANISM="Elphidium margaritaceum" /LENGTH=494 /DNA_ID=CAMNT_0049354115 /DNA_START=246 /DNA_END=1730 /DNA_ORIENTATION=-
MRSKKLIVQKFGGTSLGTQDKMEKAISIMKQFASEKETSVIVVVSALSSEVKEQGTTSRLLKAAWNAIEQKEFQSLLNQIEDTHLDVIYTMIRDRKNRENIRNEIAKELEEIRMFCTSLSVIREISPRSMDKIIGCGERMSASLVSAILCDHGLESPCLNLSNIFDGLDTTQRGGFQHTFKDRLRLMLGSAYAEEPHAVPVVTGFFGQVQHGMLNTIGRGYTDLTAALCAGAMKADTLQVWKESDGIFTGNPTKIDDAKLLSFVTPDEATELTAFGNEVLNPFTMKCCIDDNIPIQILNTFEPREQGTMVVDECTRNRYESPHGIIAVCSKKDIHVLHLTLNDQHQSLSDLSAIFALFKQYNIKSDLISTSVVNVSVAINENTKAADISAVMKALKKQLNLNGDGGVTLKKDRSIVSCIGPGMSTYDQIFACLSRQKINIEMICRGSSDMSVSVVIHSKQMDQAIKALHNDLIIDAAPHVETTTTADAKLKAYE